VSGTPPGPATRTAPTPARALRRRLAFGAAIDSFGTGLMLTTSTIYFVSVVGFGARAVGLAMSAAGVFGLLGPVPVGRLADRYGLRPVYATALVLRGAGYAGYAFVTNFRVFLVATCLLRLIDQCTPGLLQSLVSGSASGPDRAHTMGLVRGVRNSALGTGMLVAALALAVRTRPAMMATLIADGLSFFVLAAVVASIRLAGAQPRAGEPAGGEPPRAAGERSPAPLRQPRFVALTACNGLLMLHDSVLFVLLPVWIVTRSGLPASTFSMLLVINTGLTVILQLLFRRTERIAANPGRALTVAAAFLVGSCAVFAVAGGLGAAGSLAVAAAAVVLLTAGENVHAVAGWQLSFDFAPADRRSEYLSVFNLGQGLQGIAGPALMTSAVLVLGPAGWLLLAAIFTASAAGCKLAARGRAPEPSPAREEAGYA